MRWSWPRSSDLHPGERRPRNAVPACSGLARTEPPDLATDHRPQAQVTREDTPERRALESLEIVHGQLVAPQFVLERCHAPERSTELCFTGGEAVTLGQQVFADPLEALAVLDQFAPVE